MEIDAIVQLINTTPSLAFQQVVLPFLLIFAIMWGILGSLAVFKKRINLTLSIILAILAILTPTFEIFATYLAMLGGQLSLILFILVFGFGVAMWALRGGRDIYYDNVAPGKKVEQLMKRKDELVRKAGEAQDAGKTTLATDLRRKARDIEDQIHYYESREKR
jgi:hypothetical protein